MLMIKVYDTVLKNKTSQTENLHNNINGTVLFMTNRNKFGLS